MTLFSLLALVGSVAAWPTIVTQPPANDAFYTPPANLSSYAEGEIIRERQVDSVTLFTNLAEITQVLYRTTNTAGNASHTVATLFKPLIADPDAKLLSYQFWEDSNGLECSPSYTIVKGLLAPDGVVGAVDFPIVADWALAQGYYLVAADHEGPNSAFIAGHEEGRAGLDGVRAAIDGFNLPSDVSVVLHGYSGGAHATAWMSNIAEDYAPEINIIGATWGGTPVDLKAMVDFLDGTVFSGFVGAGFAGALNAYPQFLPIFDSSVNSNFLSAMNKINGSCLPEILLGNMFANYTNELLVPDLWTVPAVEYITGQESLLSNVSTVGVAVPKYPRFIYHSKTDEIVPYAADKEYISQQCEQGANIQFLTYPSGGHITTLAVGVPGALQFIKQVFDGTTPDVVCGTVSPNVLSVHSSNLAEELGQDIARAIQHLNGAKTPLGDISF